MTTPPMGQDPLPAETAAETTMTRSDDLKPVIADGVAVSVMLGCGENFLSAFAVALNGTPLQIGTLASLPPFLGALSQMGVLRFLDSYRKRRALILGAVIAQALLWLPIASLPFLFGSGAHTVELLIGLVIAYHVLAALAAPAWSSLVGDLVPENLRGRFFGRRNMYMGIGTFLGIIGGGLLLEGFQRAQLPLFGFGVIFLAAFSARLVSAYWINRYPEIEYRKNPEERFSFAAFLRRSYRSNFGRFVLFRGTMMFSTYIAAPYFALFMLRELNFSYWTFTLVTGLSTVAGFITMEHWGRLSDIFGNKKILTIASYGVSIVPFLWLFSGNVLYLIFVQIYAGFAWAGFNLAADNYIFDAVTPPKRARCVAYHAAILGVFVLLGSFAGSALLETPCRHLSFNHWSIELQSLFPFLFLASGVLRLASCVFWRGRFIETREVTPIRYRDLLFEIIRIRPFSQFRSSSLCHHEVEEKSVSSAPPADERHR